AAFMVSERNSFRDDEVVIGDGGAVTCYRSSFRAGIWASQLRARRSGSLTARHRLTRKARREAPSALLLATNHSRHSWESVFSISATFFSNSRSVFCISPKRLKAAVERSQSRLSNPGIPEMTFPGGTS